MGGVVNGPSVYQDLLQNYIIQTEWYGTRINREKKVKRMEINSYKVLYKTGMAMEEISGKRINYSLNAAEATGYP